MLSRYELLKQAGHSPAKAREIELDAQRKDEHARWWLKVLRMAERVK
jgi:hypothetical protein